MDATLALSLEPLRSSLRPGLRLGLAVSGGADSVALLRAMLSAAPQMGLVLHVVHLDHGLRGAESAADATFVASLAAQFALPFHTLQVDTKSYAQEHRQGIEEAARNLRYGYFEALLSAGTLDAIATAHTLDDQAETVLLKLLRGAWTEGLSAIHPQLSGKQGAILRPMLGVTRAQIEQYLHALGQDWREDSSNQDLAFTRNRMRHQILPALRAINPQVGTQLAQVATLAREEEQYWQQEVERLMPQLLLPGRAVRGGGRAVATSAEPESLGIERERLTAMMPALRRRILRGAAQRLGASLNFTAVEQLMAMLNPDGPRQTQLTAELRAERTPRELRLLRKLASAPASDRKLAPLTIAIPGKTEAKDYGLLVEARLVSKTDTNLAKAILRTPEAGDRVRLRYSAGLKSMKEVFARLKLDTTRKANWPLIAWQGKIVWMQEVPLEPDPLLPFTLTVTLRPEA